jgi:hypothetical protein
MSVTPASSLLALPLQLASKSPSLNLYIREAIAAHSSVSNSRTDVDGSFTSVRLKLFRRRLDRSRIAEKRNIAASGNDITP